MIARKQFMKFCDNHNIKYNENEILIRGNYFVKFKEAKDPNLDKSLVYPSGTFISVSFIDKDYDETDYLYKPFEKLYGSTVPDEYEMYNYKAYGDIHILAPIHCYTEKWLKGMFSTKNFSKKDAIETTIPFNTLDQLEHLYGKFNQFTADIKDFYYSESFQQAIQTYKDNMKTTKELKTANEDLVKKTFQIIQRKHELSEDFIK